MSLLVLFVLMVVALQVPALVPNVWDIPGHAPDLWLAVVVYLALRAPGFRSVGWAVLIGAVRDAVSLDALGTNAFVLGFVAFLLCEGRRERGRIVGTQRLAFVFGGSLLASWIYLVRSLPLAEGVVSWELFLGAFPTALWTTLLAAPLYGLLDRFHLLDEMSGRARALRT